MHLKGFPDWQRTVAHNWKRTTAYLLAMREPCITIRDDGLASIKENRVLVALDGRPKWKPKGSWFLAVLLCRGDDIQSLVDWLPADQAGRVHFYAQPETDVFQALQPWQEAGLPDPKVDEDIDSWKRLHKRFGRDLSVRILEDWG